MFGEKCMFVAYGQIRHTLLDSVLISKFWVKGCVDDMTLYGVSAAQERNLGMSW